MKSIGWTTVGVGLSLAWGRTRPLRHVVGNFGYTQGFQGEEVGQKDSMKRIRTDSVVLRRAVGNLNHRVHFQHFAVKMFRIHL